MDHGKHAAQGSRLKKKIGKIRIMERISSHVLNFIMEEENSWIEVLNQNDLMNIDDINMNMDMFYVVRGAIEFTMREDAI